MALELLFMNKDRGWVDCQTYRVKIDWRLTKYSQMFLFTCDGQAITKTDPISVAKPKMRDILVLNFIKQADTLTSQMGGSLTLHNLD